MLEVQHFLLFLLQRYYENYLLSENYLDDEELVQFDSLVDYEVLCEVHE